MMRKWIVVQGIYDSSVWAVKPEKEPDTSKFVIYTVSKESAENLSNILNTLESKLEKIYNVITVLG